MTLANVALSRADAAGWQKAIDAVEHVASHVAWSPSFVRAMLDTVRGSLLVELGEGPRIADWLPD